MKHLPLLILLSLFACGCTGLNANKNFPRTERQKFVDKFAYFESNGFGGYFRIKPELETEKAKWKGKCLVLFLPNVVAEHPTIPAQFHEFPEDWKATNFKEIDTLVLLQFRGGTQEKLLNQKPRPLKLVMYLIDAKKKVMLRTIKVKEWDAGTDRAAQQRDLPNLQDVLKKRRAI